MKDVIINSTFKVNNKSIRTVWEDDREYLVVPSITMPDDIIMNGGMYPKAEIEAAYKGLENTPAPLGHPKRNGVEIPALDPLAINAYHIGATNRNVRRERGRVYLEKWIDVLRANESEGGRRVLEAIKKNRPIHTSTGVYAKQQLVTNGDGYNWVARNLRFDHDAILLDEAGAATPSEGVGMLVNSEGKEIECLIVNNVVEPKKPSLRAMIREFLTNENTLENFEVELNPEPAKLPKEPTEPKEVDTLDEKAQAAFATLIANALAAQLAPIGEALAKINQGSEALALKINEQTEVLKEQAESKLKSEQAEMLEALTEAHGPLVANALIKDLPAAEEAFAKLKTASPLNSRMRVNSSNSGKLDDGLDDYVPGAKE